MDTAQKVSEIAVQMAYPITCIGIPKTVDNDLPITDCCPGFGSAAKYIAVSTREAALDVASMARTSTKVFVLEVMGRHAGWMAAAGGLAGEKAGDAPHIILFPEIVFDRERFLAKVKLMRGEIRLLRHRGLRRRARARRQISRRGRHQGRLRPLAAGRRGTGGRANDPGSLRLQIPLGGGRLSAALGAAHRLQGGRRSGLRGRQGGGRIGAQGQERGHARHRPQILQALPLEHRRSAA